MARSAKRHGSAAAGGRRPTARRPAATPALRADMLLGRLLHRDGLVLIVDKPAGLPVHAGPGGGDNLERYFDALRFGLPRPPALAHRLDRDTSGCLVLGRHPKALRRLGRLFSEGLAEKTYWAVVAGAPAAESGQVDLPLRKLTRNTGWRMVGDPQGQPAVTDWRVMARGEGVTWLELKPRTGRTHQIRVHCAALGCPVLGDPVYGETRPPGAALHLHARAIVLPLYENKPPVAAEAPLPPHMAATFAAQGWPLPAAPTPSGAAEGSGAEDGRAD